MKALCDLVRDASPGDAFVFFCTPLPTSTLFLLITPSLDAGHSGQQTATTDPNEVDGLDECQPNLILFPRSPRTLTSWLGYSYCDARFQDHP